MKTKYLAVAVAAALSMSAHAAVATTHEVCGALPNSNWWWNVTESGGGSSSATTYGDVSYSGNSGNGTAQATITTTTTAPTTICTAMNPGGNAVADKSTTIPGATTITIADGGTVQVCFNSPNADDLIAGCR
jgi:hypothetical protein